MTTQILNPEAAAVSTLLAGYHAAVADRTTLMTALATGPERIEQLAEANRIDSGHAEVAEALIEALNADPGRPYFQHALIGGTPSQGKAASPRLLAMLAAVLDAEFDLAALDGADAAALMHDHQAPGCPACLLHGAGDLAALDGIDTGAEADR